MPKKIYLPIYINPNFYQFYYTKKNEILPFLTNYFIRVHYLKSERLLSDLTAFETGLAKPASIGELEDVSEDRVDPPAVL